MTSSDIFEGIAAISQLGSWAVVAIGAWIANRQLHLWKEQEGVKQRVDAARNLLVIATTVSETMKAIRTPFSQTPLSEVNNPLYIYNLRNKLFNDHQDLFIKLRDAQITADAVIDNPEVDAAVDVLFKVRSDTMFAIQQLAMYDDDGNDNMKSLAKGWRNNMFGGYSAKHDPLGMEQLEAIKTLRAVLKPIISFSSKVKR